jgi:riboflavin synthase
MFTGIVEETGRVVRMQPVQTGARLTLEAPGITQDLRPGDSVAVNGCCLTVTAIDGHTLGFDVLAETLRCTNLGDLQTESRVNLERALVAGGRLGGHFVQGHVDCPAKILALEPVGTDHRLEIELPAHAAQYVVFKGSIAVNGISLTVAEVLERSFVIWIIPHTMEATTLGAAKTGDRVNLEFDLLAKYVERLMEGRGA